MGGGSGGMDTPTEVILSKGVRENQRMDIFSVKADLYLCLSDRLRIAMQVQGAESLFVFGKPIPVSLESCTVAA